MFKSVLTICLWTMVLLLSGASAWSGDIEDRFIDADFDSSKSIFIDVKGSSLDNVLKIISQQSGLSFIASQDVADKKITVYLNKIPLNQALETVLDANGLMYEMQGDSNVFVIKAKPATAKNLITKVYQLKYATVSTSPLNSTIDTTSPSLSSGSDSSSSSGSSSSSSGSSSSGSSSSSGGSSAPAASPSSGGLEAVLRNSLSPDGKVVEDVRTNSLIVTDVPAQFVIIDNTIAKLDVPIPEVLIEVEMLDVSKSKADQLGITYGATPLTFTGGSYNTNWPFGHFQGIQPSAIGASASSSSGSSSGSSSTSSPPVALNANGMTAAVNFLTTTTDARILARPRILTLNNQTALIQISTDQVASVTANVSTTTSSAVTTYTPQRYNTGITLKVTPQANLLTGEVTMAVSPRDIDLIQSEVQPPNPSLNGVYFDPQTRGSDSILELKDGQSMMIGGLMDNQTINTVVKLPVLGDLPLVGAAFRSRNTQKSERELIIFLTPHIINNSDSLAIPKDNSATSSQGYSNNQDAQDASNRSQEINNSLNNYDQ